jgi:hypothetical protein
MNKEKFRKEVIDLVLKHPPEIAMWGNIFRLEEQGRYEEAKKLRKFFEPKKGIPQYVRYFVEDYITDPICNVYKSLFKQKPIS